MHKTPKHVFDEIVAERPTCERKELLHDHDCGGRSTMEHCFIYAGRQVNDKWAIIRICEKAHGLGAYAFNGILDKSINRWIALGHATDEDLAKYPKADWKNLKNYLNRKYGESKHHQTHAGTGGGAGE